MKTDIKRIREENGETQFELSMATGIQNSYISKLENGTIENPGIETIVKIADHYGVSVDSIVGRDGNGRASVEA